MGSSEGANPDYSALFNRDFPQVIGNEAEAQPGDIYLALQPRAEADARLGSHPDAPPP